MSNFMFTDQEVSILKNFAGIHPSIVIKPEGISVKNDSNSIIAYQTFEKAYDFKTFGIYDVAKFISMLSALKKPQIEVFPDKKYLHITDGNYKFQHTTSALEIMPKVPDIKPKFDDLETDLQLDVSGEKLALIFKTANILESDYVFFETDKKKVRITIGNKLESSIDNFEIVVEDGIKVNKLTKAIKIPISDLKLFTGDYKVTVKGKFSCWENLAGPTYFIGVLVV